MQLDSQRISFTPRLQRGGYKGVLDTKNRSTVFLLGLAKAVETAAWFSQRLLITGLKPRCE